MSKVNWNNKLYIQNIVKNSYSISDALRKLELSLYRNNRIRLKSFISDNNLDTSHFTSQQDRVKEFLREAPLEQVFKENSLFDNKNIKKKILKYNLIEYKCNNSKCNIREEWLGSKIVLQLDHINGINNDHRLENLRFLCPNCHSQQHTSNKGKLKAEIKKKELKIKEIIYKIDWPNNEELQKLLLEYPMSKLSVILGVSDRVIAKTARKRNLNIPPRGYWIKNK